MPTSEERLSRLEELNFFQEEQLKALNEALTAQQTQLDCLQKELGKTVELVRVLRESLAQQPENALPPHFMPERY